MALRLIQDVGVHDTTSQAALITAFGVIVVAMIGFFSAKVSSGARDTAKESSKEASQSATLAKGYVEALKAKDELIYTLENRVKVLEAERILMTRRIDHLEGRKDETKSKEK